MGHRSLPQARCDWAPFEADPQCAYLSLRGLVGLVISEDSDLLVYGCLKVLYKLQPNGSGELVTREALASLPRSHLAVGRKRANQDSRALAFAPRALWWGEGKGEDGKVDPPGGMFVDFSVLAGCDYNKKLPGMGIKTAYQLMMAHKTLKDAVYAHWMQEGIAKKQVGRRGLPWDPESCLREMYCSVDAFRHQRVLCPAKRMVVTLHPQPCLPGQHPMPLPHCGEPMDQQWAAAECVRSKLHLLLQDVQAPMRPSQPALMPVHCVPPVLSPHPVPHLPPSPTSTP